MTLPLLFLFGCGMWDVACTVGTYHGYVFLFIFNSTFELFTITLTITIPDHRDTPSMILHTHTVFRACCTYIHLRVSVSCILTLFTNTRHDMSHVSSYDSCAHISIS